MEIDSRAAMSIMSQKMYKKWFSRFKLCSSEVVLKDYSGKVISVIGEMGVTVKCGDQVLKSVLLVSLSLDWSQVNHVACPVEQLCDKYSEVFSDKLGLVKGVQATVHVSEKAVPKFCKARLVPYTLRDAVDKHLVELEEQGVITPIEYSEWASPIVCLPKKTGKVRICGDYKVVVNEWVEVDQYPLPRHRISLLH